METRLCKKCATIKPLTEFYKNKDCENGLMLYCKKCKQLQVQFWREKNVEKCKLTSKKWREKNPLYYKNYLETHILTYKRKYKQYSQNPLYYKNWYKKNIEHINLLRKKKYQENQKYREGIKKREKNKTEIISNGYLINLLKQKFALKTKTIRQYPEFIEYYKQQIKLKRLLKTIKSKNHGREKNEKSIKAG